MIAVVCLDDNNGMMFNHRRQSRDEVVIEDMLAVAGGKLWMNTYSSKLFEKALDQIVIEDDPADKAPANSYCFFENIPLKLYVDKIEGIIVYCWNRVYPADTYMDIDLGQGWRIMEEKEFGGKSHEKITRKMFKCEM